MVLLTKVSRISLLTFCEHAHMSVIGVIWLSREIHQHFRMNSVLQGGDAMALMENIEQTPHNCNEWAFHWRKVRIQESRTIWQVEMAWMWWEQQTDQCAHNGDIEHSRWIRVNCKAEQRGVDVHGHVRGAEMLARPGASWALYTTNLRKN